MPEDINKGNTVNLDGTIPAAAPVDANEAIAEQNAVADIEAILDAEGKEEKTNPATNPNPNVDNDLEDDENGSETTENPEDVQGDGDDGNGQANDESAEQDDDEPHNKKVTFTPEQQEVFNREVGKQRRKADELQGEIDTLRTNYERLQTQQAAKVIPAATPEFPLPQVLTINDLEAMQRDAQDAYDFACAHETKVVGHDEDGNEIAAIIELAEGKTRKLSKSEIIEIKNKAQRKLNIEIPKRAAYLNNERNAKNFLETEFPVLKNPDSEVSKKVASVIASFPQLKYSPAYSHEAFAYMLGKEFLAIARNKSLDMLEDLRKTHGKPPAAPAKKAAPPAPRKPKSVVAADANPQPKPTAPVKVTPSNIVNTIESLL